MHTETLDLREVLVFLAAAGLIVPLMQRFRINPVIGFLAVGCVISPSGIGRFLEPVPYLSAIVISDVEGVRGLAELGVVFLLFMIGLELSLDRLWAMRRLVFGLGAAQVVLTSLVIGAVAYGFGNPAPAATILGMCLALSSTAIVMQLLSEGRRLGTPTGRASFGVLLFQDLAVVPILFLVGVLGARTQGSLPTAMLAAFGEAAVAVAAILGLGRLVVRPLFRFVGGARSRELFLAAVLLVIIGTAAVTQRAGLSLALGAFLAGLLFSETEYRHQIEADIEPFKGLLLGLFFVSVGMSLDPAAVARDWAWLALSVPGLIAIKAALASALVRGAGQPWPVALEAGLLLAQGGEFAFVVVGLALSLGLLPPATAQFMLLVVVATMILTPGLAAAGRGLSRRAGVRGATPARAPEELAGHIVIAGYGRAGQMLGSLLESQRIPHLAVDRDAGLVADLRSEGLPVHFGDASLPDILKHLGLDRAQGFVTTMDDPRAAERVVAAVRRGWPRLPVYARARDAAHAARLERGGATVVVPEAVEGTLQLGTSLLVGVGVPRDAAREIVGAKRDALLGAGASGGMPGG